MGCSGSGIHAPRQSVQIILQNTWEDGQHRGLPVGRSAKEMLDDNVKTWTSLLMSQLLTMASRKKKKTGRGSLLNRPSCPPDDPIGRGTESTPGIYGGQEQSWRRAMNVCCPQCNGCVLASAEFNANCRSPAERAFS